MKIRLCHHNQGADLLQQQLSVERPGLDSKLKKCVKQCKTCRRQPFALCDKELLTAASTEELCLILLKKIDGVEYSKIKIVK